MEEAEILTRLFPISMAESILPESSVTRRTLAAFLFPDSASVRIRILFTVVSDVSADEKNADSAINAIKNEKTIKKFFDADQQNKQETQDTIRDNF